MKVLNVSESTVFLDDINFAVIYTRKNEPVEIPDALAKKSRTLKAAIQQHMLIDVTNGIPDVIPKYAPPKQIQPDPESPYFKKQAMLSKDEHNGPKTAVSPLHSMIQDLAAASALPDIGESAIQAFKDSGKISCLWSGPAADAGGYARMNRKFMFGLAEMGVHVKYDQLASINDMDKITNDELRKLVSNKVPKNALKIYGMTAPLHYDWSRYKMLFTMMETRKLHEDYVARCNCADEIVVPSHWCKQVFEESGVTKPMSVVPLGVDTNIYKPGLERLGFTKKLKPFIFLSVFGWSLRKGYDVLLRSYLEEFTSDDPVTLLIASRYFGSTDECKKQVIRDDIAKISSTVSNPKKPQVVLFGDVLSDAMMPRLYAAADCYCLISRGEGFGLPYIEAGACNVPVIASRYSGQTDFLNDENSYLVDVDGFRSADTTLAWISYFYEDAEFPIFGQKAVEQTRHYMRRVFENKEEAKAKANKLYQKVVPEYSWPNCMQAMYDKLKSTYTNLAGN